MRPVSSARTLSSALFILAMMWKRSEDMQGLGASFANELQVRFPHIGADEADLGNDFLAHGGKESLEGLDGPFLAHPEQTGDTDIDLVNQRQILVAFGVLDFVN